MEIKVFGSGCAKCKTLEQLAREVVNEMSVEASIEKITDFKEIAKAGIMMTPGLAINGKVKLSGKVPTKAELTQHHYVSFGRILRRKYLKNNRSGIWCIWHHFSSHCGGRYLNSRFCSFSHGGNAV